LNSITRETLPPQKKCHPPTNCHPERSRGICFFPRDNRPRHKKPLRTIPVRRGSIKPSRLYKQDTKYRKAKSTQNSCRFFFASFSLAHAFRGQECPRHAKQTEKATLISERGLSSR
jgi:hypothetical protein